MGRGIVESSISKNKTMLLNTLKIKHHLPTRLRRAGALLVLCLVIASSTASPLARADQYDEQIRALQAQNAQSRASVTGLQAQASSYQGVIDNLQNQINAIQAQITANQQQQAQLEREIAEAQAKLDRERLILGDDLRTMYIDGQMSTIEELATSKSLSEYVDKQEYRVVAQDRITASLKEIAALQAQLKIKKTEVETLLAAEKSQNDQLAADQAQQQQLLNFNQSQQAAFNQQISANSSRIGELRRQQAIENSRYNIGNFRGDPNNGGYPTVWANAPQDSMLDNWGMYNRECVSYTAFMVHQDFLAGKTNRDMPYWGGVGNANQWDDNARAAGIPVDSNPTPGSIAISNAGYYGHAMYVQAVNGNEIYVQQYNAQLTGQYSEGWRYTTGLVFIHF
ncbi:MAG TPA: CHAP domain-containing protein [Candidatus Saccharimonadales bacterium]|nr:CHAP domain-containing protein [Candidatus Saccharimonadales bacterium]